MGILAISPPVHTCVHFGHKLLGFRVPVSEVVAAAQGMADAKQHPSVVYREEVGAGDVLVLVDVGQVVFQEVAEISPVPKIVRFQDGRVPAAGDGVVRVADEETIRIPVSHFRFLPIGCFGLDRKGPLPRGEPAVLRDGDLVPA